MLPPRPPRSFKARKGTVLWVPVDPKLAVKLELRWMREELGLTQAELAKLAGVSQPAIAQLESPDSNPTIDTLNRVASAMAAQIDFHPSAGESEKSLLHETVRAHLKTFLAEMEQDGSGLPRFVVAEFERSLRCGILAHGFARVRSIACGDELLVAFSCNRGICPSCTTRRMQGTA